MKNKVVTICAILKDEHQYLKEWINYHLNIGVDQIYLYEDVTSKTHIDITKDYDDVHLMSMGDFIDMDNCLEKQRDTYNKFIETYKDNIDYAFFIDIDEFVDFADDYTLEDLINQCDEWGAVLLPWKYYGACGNVDNPKTDVVTTYHTYTPIKFPKNPNGCKLMAKAFVNMKEGRMKHIHYHTHSVPIVPWDNEDLYTKCWLNHYITKSWEEWCNRLFVRGQNMALRKPDEFFDYNPDMLPIKEELYKKDCFKIDNYIVDGKIENILL